jgi:hypothetical protein
MLDSEPPQPPQNFSPGSFANPHVGHATGNAAPHCEQNRRPARFSALQFVQTSRLPSLIARLESRRARSAGSRQPLTLHRAPSESTNSASVTPCNGAGSRVKRIPAAVIAL